ncbi:hypothetical protein ACFL2T_01120 [Elusimicrobiota bacterium]
MAQKRITNKLEHSGNHHMFELSADEQGRIKSGGLALFANNGGGVIGVENGKPKGQVAYATKDSSLKLKVTPKGYTGAFKDKKRNIDIVFRKGKAEVQGKIPPEGTTIRQRTGKYDVNLNISPRGKVTGTISAKANKNASIDLSLKQGNRVEAMFRHKGGSHELFVVGDSKGNVGVGVNIKGFKFSASTKRGGSVFAKFGMKFG